MPTDQPRSMIDSPRMASSTLSDVPEDQPIPATFDRVALDPARIGVFVDDWRLSPLERAA